MDGYFNKRFVSNFALAINITFLCMHIVFFALFTILEVYVMSFLNVVSICFYMLGFDFIKKSRMAVYVYLVALEVLIHMVAAVTCVGLGCNFQLCLVGMISLFFVSEYVGKVVYKEKVHGAETAYVYSALIVALYIFGIIHKPLYSINESVEKVASIIIVAIVLVAFLMTLVLFKELSIYQDDRLSKQAYYDALTGLPNRFYLLTKLDKMFESCEQEDYYMAMIDIDDFKKINDTYGHNVGDEALKILAKIVYENCSGMDYCRWGGEEFIIVAQCKNDQIETGFLDELRQCVNACSIKTNRGSIRMTVTIGAAKYKRNQSVEEWVDAVDRQLYIGKCSGKNKVVCEE